MSIQETYLQGIADAIRSKDGTTDSIQASKFAERISAIQVGVDTSDATATAENIDSGKTAYVNGEKVTGTSTKVDTSDATAAAGDIAEGKTAYVNGDKVIGTLSNALVKIGNASCSSHTKLNANSANVVNNNSLSGLSGLTLQLGDYLVGDSLDIRGMVGANTGTTMVNLTGKALSTDMTTYYVYRKVTNA